MSALTLAKTAAGELSRRDRIVVLAICCTSLLVVVMDISIVNVALPAIRRDLPTPRCPACSGRSTPTPWCWPAS